MNRAVRIVLACSWIACFGPSATQASTLIFTNSPCVYLLVSNSLSQSATLLGPTGLIAGALTVPVSVKSSLFSVTAIAPGAFKDCGGLTDVSFDASSKVAVIGAGAFWGCTNLAVVTLRDSVAVVGPSAFLGCASLTNVNLAAATGLTAVAQQTFSGCTRLPALLLPDGVADIGPCAFRDCSSLTNIVVPSGVASLPDSVFQGCRRLEAVSFEGVSDLGINAFAETGLAHAVIPSTVTAVAQGTFANCTNLADVTCDASALEELGCAAFRGCSALTNLPLPAALVNVASSTFAGCSRVKRVTLPSGMAFVPDNLFAGCSSLAAVASESSVASLGSCSFVECPALTNVTLKGDAPSADDTSFERSTNVFVYYYKGAGGWGNLLAGRPTVMLGADGAVSSPSFAAWAVRNGLVSAADLDAAALEAAFEDESSSWPRLANGAVYAFGDNLKSADRTSLIDIVFDDAGTPIVVIPAVAGDNASFVTVAVQGKTELSSDAWTLDMQPVSLSDATRTGFTPVGADGYTPATACFRLRLSLRE